MERKKPTILDNPPNEEVENKADEKQMIDIYGNEVIVNPQKISPEIKKEMWKFFQKTSIPRIIAEHRAKDKIKDGESD
ncbi:TPA: hypothetical protein ROX88_001851 [Bacillus pseudomycoides]|nr:hypothetical protein [Bacillus pseudomycoides]